MKNTYITRILAISIMVLTVFSHTLSSTVFAKSSSSSGGKGGSSSSGKSPSPSPGKSNSNGPAASTSNSPSQNGKSKSNSNGPAASTSNSPSQNGKAKSYNPPSERSPKERAFTQAPLPSGAKNAVSPTGAGKIGAKSPNLPGSYVQCANNYTTITDSAGRIAGHFATPNQPAAAKSAKASTPGPSKGPNPGPTPGPSKGPNPGPTPGKGPNPGPTPGPTPGGSPTLIPPRPICANGATNPPSCDACPAGKILYNNRCETACTNGATNPPACNICGSSSYYYNLNSKSCVPNPCPSGVTPPSNYGATCNSGTNICGQSTSGTITCNGCSAVSVNNNSCITTFNVTSTSVQPNGSVEFSWNVINPTGVKCSFYDRSKPQAGSTLGTPIAGLQDLDGTVDKIRINNIQRSTEFCLYCKYPGLGTPAASHQWVRVIRVGEN